MRVILAMAGQSLFSFQSTQADYWRPARPDTGPAAKVTSICDRCDAELLIESRFCHRCGQARGQALAARSRLLDGALGEQLAPAAAFIIGLACVAAALGTGWLQNQSTTAGWQAVQVYRLEWLLGSAVAFLAGIFLYQTCSTR